MSCQKDLCCTAASIMTSIIIFAISESDEDCNSIFGCYELMPEGLELCTCYRDCQEDGQKICGSDGQIHASKCDMEVNACINDIYMEVMPMEYCMPQPGQCHIHIYICYKLYEIIFNFSKKISYYFCSFVKKNVLKWFGKYRFHTYKI